MILFLILVVSYLIKLLGLYFNGWWPYRFSPYFLTTALANYFLLQKFVVRNAIQLCPAVYGFQLYTITSNVEDVFPC